MSDPVVPTETPSTMPPPLPLAPPPAAERPRSHRAIVALLLSLFPGMGQVFNGQIVKALVFFFAWVGSIWFTAEGDWRFAFVIPFVYLFNLVDAYRTAAFRGAPPEGVEPSPESPGWGVGLIGLGFVLLLNNLGWLRLSAFSRYWPLLLILGGAVFLWNTMRSNGTGSR